MRKNKVLAIFGNVVNFGQERSNTEVFRLLINDGYDVLSLVNDRGFHWHLQSNFDQFKIPYQKIRFPWGVSKKSSKKHLCQWVIDVIFNNIQFIFYYLKFRPDYIHFGNEYMFKTLFLPLIFVRAKIIFRLGDEPTINYAHNKLLWKYIICKKVKTFVCVSKFIQNKLKTCGRIPSVQNNDKVIYNFPPNRIQSEPIKSENKLFTIGFIGQISENKGVAILAQAAVVLCKKYQDICFVFAGAIDDNLFAKEVLESINKESQSVQQRISFIGLIDDVALFYSNLNICITPSIYREALGNVIVEAKLYGKPSVIFKTGGMPELIHHCEDGYICSDKTLEALIEGIEYYIKNPIKSEEHGQNAFKSIKEMGLDYESFKAKWFNVYPL
ncbi:MAG: glycosyltransferase family 4 protein [bacterium]